MVKFTIKLNLISGKRPADCGVAVGGVLHLAMLMFSWIAPRPSNTASLALFVPLATTQLDTVLTSLSLATRWQQQSLFAQLAPNLPGPLHSTGRPQRGHLRALEGARIVRCRI